MNKSLRLLSGGGVLVTSVYFLTKALTTPRNLTKNPFYECDNDSYKTLRSGDLIFIKYNLERLTLYSRYKLALMRFLAREHIYDDLGIIYKGGDNIYIILLPSVKLSSRCDLNELNISNKKFAGLCAIDYIELINDNYPDLISIRRLICPDELRNEIIKSLKSVAFNMRYSVNSKLLSIFNSWIQILPFLKKDSRGLIESLTNYNEFKYIRESLAFNSFAIFNEIQPKLVRSFKHDDSDEGIRTQLDNLFNLSGLIENYDKGMDMSRDIINRFKSVKGNGVSRTLNTETSLIQEVYMDTHILPLGNFRKTLNISHFCQFDHLYNNTRLSSLYHIYTGGINRVRYNNLKYPQIRNLVEYKF